MALTIDQLNIQIEAESTKAVSAIDALIGRLETLQSKLNVLGKAGKNAGNGLTKTANSAQKAATATDKHRNSTDKASKSTKSFSDRLAQQISKYRTLIGAFKSAANVMGNWYNESNEYIETLNLFNVTMGDAAESASEFADSVQSLMGIDAKDWMQYQGVFKNLASGFGVAGDAANVMSQNLTQLSYDMASFFNTDVETAFDKLSSAMSGQVKGLREFGIDTTVASLQEYALAKGIDAKVRSMTQAEKSLLRYNYIMEKSIIMQGDMARTIITPANALRVLEAQLTQMKRAFGNIISVLITQLIPYVQAFVKVVTEAANALAKLFGFELPEIDYSSLGGNLASGFEDAEDSADGVADAAKKIKKQLMGFDELNILSNPDSDSSATGSTAGGSLNGMEPLEYDFLKGLDTSKADEIYDTVKKCLSPLKKIADYLDDYTDTLLAIGGLIAGFGLIKKIKKLVTAFLGLKIISDFITYFKVLRLEGNGLFKSFTGAIGGVRDGLTGVQKTAIVAAAGVIEFFAVKDSVKALALGCEDVGEKILTIGVVAGTAAAAMYAALGPAGLAVAALTLIGGLVTGLYEAHIDLREEFMNTTVFDDHGIAIGDLTGILEDLWSSISLNAGRINEIGDKVKANDDVIANSQVGIGTYMTNLKNAGTITKEQAKAMSDDVAALAKAVKDNIEYNANIVFESFAHVSEETAKQLGIDVGTMTTILNQFKQTFSSKVTELENTSQGYLTRLANGEILDADEMSKLEETLDYLSDMSGETYANQEKVKRALQDLVDVDFGSVEESQEAIKQMTDLGIQMNTDLDTAYETALTSIDTMMAQAKTMLDHGDLTQTAYDSFANVMANYKDGITAGYEQNKSEIQNQMQTVFDYIEGQINQAGLDLYDESLNNFKDLSWWEKIWYQDEYDYAAEVAEDFKSDIGDPLFTSVEDAKKTLSMASESAGRATMNSFIDAAVKAGADATTQNGNELRKLGKSAIEGYRVGIKENTQSVVDAFGLMTQSGMDAVAETQDSHSPSKEFAKLGTYAVQGYANSVADNFSKIEDAFIKNFEKLFNNIAKLAKNSFSESVWSGYVNGITKALSNIKMPKFKSIGLNVNFSSFVSAEKKAIYEALGLSGWPSMQWYTYAQGGFPDVGEMFIARERGPELVGSIGRKTAVANNDQIVSGIEDGVYRAMVAANANGGGGGTQTIRIINEIDGDVVGEKVIKYHNGKVMQTGASPLLV